MEIPDFLSHWDTYKSIAKYCVGPLAGSFAGSFLTYLYALKKEKNSICKQNTLAGDKALHLLCRNCQELIFIKNTNFPKTKKEKDYYLGSSITLGRKIEEYYINNSELTFLLSSNKILLSEIAQLEDQFVGIAALLHNRKQYFDNNFHEIFAYISKDFKVIPSIKANGAAILLQKLTDGLIDQIDLCIKLHVNTIQSLSSHLHLLYPNYNFIKIKPERDAIEFIYE